MRSSDPGLISRSSAAFVVDTVLSRGRTVGDALADEGGVDLLDARDRALVLKIVLTTLRRKGQIDAVIGRFVSKALPRKAGPVLAILQTAVAQLLFLDMPAHAVIDVAVEVARRERRARHFSGLVNAVLRKVAQEGSIIAASQDVSVNTPDWLWERWVAQYGGDIATRIVKAHLEEPSVDIAVKSDPIGWANRLGGLMLPFGQIRLSTGSRRISDLPGYHDGSWWVQDAAAGLPARVLGDVEGRSVLDLCAAPGGKTMQLAAGQARVTAVDSSEKRLQRLRENLRRTHLEAELVCADVLTFEVNHRFDIVLLDAPCSATGTIRRHPELPYLKTDDQILMLAQLQQEMLDSAARHVREGGILVYCTCSLEREEGEDPISRFLVENSQFRLADDLVDNMTGVPADFRAGPGQLRTLPYMSMGDARGLDGFFVAAMTRTG